MEGDYFDYGFEESSDKNLERRFDSDFEKDLVDEGEMDESEEVFLVYIKQNEIQIGSSLKNKKIKMSKHIQNHVLALPSSVEKELKKKLTDVKDKYDSYQKRNRTSSYLQ